MIDMYLYDDYESAQVQFVGFVGEHSRYDLMLVQTNRHFGKTIVLNMQTCMALQRVIKSVWVIRI